MYAFAPMAMCDESISGVRTLSWGEAVRRVFVLEQKAKGSLMSSRRPWRGRRLGRRQRGAMQVEVVVIASAPRAA